MPTPLRLRLLLPLWSLWRLLLAGCLCVAIPLQGYAAVSKALCPHHVAGAAGVAVPATAADVNAPQALHHHPFGDPTGDLANTHAHTLAHSNAHMHGPSLGPSSLGHAHPPQADAHTTTDCSQCGDCCPGLAPMPSGTLATTATPPAQAAPTVASAPAPTFLTSGPERPPRHSA
jgi:hypothetical protein